MCEIVSVIIPIFNGEKYLSQCIESIIGQSYYNLDIILVDDGSTDNTGNICKIYKEKDARIRVFSITNNGVSNARNIGINNANGNYITFVDADDIIEENYISTLLRILKNDCQLAICGTNYIKNDKVISSTKWVKKDTYVQSCDFRISSDIQHLSVWGILFESKIIQGLEFDESLFVGEDALYFCNLVLKCNKIGYTHERLYNYRLLDSSASKGEFSEKKYTEINAWKKIVKLFMKTNEKMGNEAQAELAIRCIHVYNLMCRSNIVDTGKERELLDTIKKNYKTAFRVARNNRYRLWIILIILFPKIYRKIYYYKERFKHKLC